MPFKIRGTILALRGGRSVHRNPAVEVRLGSRSVVCPAPHAAFNLDVGDDNELQENLLEFKVHENGANSANDICGIAFVDVRAAPRRVRGWLALYDTMRGVCGEIEVEIAVSGLENVNPYAGASMRVFVRACAEPHDYCTVHDPHEAEEHVQELTLDGISEIAGDSGEMSDSSASSGPPVVISSSAPDFPLSTLSEHYPGYTASLGHSRKLPRRHTGVVRLTLVGACHAAADPESDFIDKFRASRASNEARQQLLQRTSAAARRDACQRAVQLHASELCGYKSHIDLAKDEAIVARAIATAVVQKKVGTAGDASDSNYCTTSMAATGMNDRCKNPSTGGTGDTLESGYKESTGFDEIMMGVVGDWLPDDSKSGKPEYEQNSHGIEKGHKSLGNNHISHEIVEAHIFTVSSHPSFRLVRIGGIATGYVMVASADAENAGKLRKRLNELREAVLRNAEAFLCDYVVGYDETIAVQDDMMIIKGEGTAVTIAWKDEVDGYSRRNNGSPQEEPVKSTKQLTKSDGICCSNSVSKDLTRYVEKVKDGENDYQLVGSTTQKGSCDVSRQSEKSDGERLLRKSQSDQSLDTGDDKEAKNIDGENNNSADVEQYSDEKAKQSSKEFDSNEKYDDKTSKCVYDEHNKLGNEQESIVSFSKQDQPTLEESVPPELNGKEMYEKQTNLENGDESNDFTAKSQETLLSSSHFESRKTDPDASTASNEKAGFDDKAAFCPASCFHLPAPPPLSRWYSGRFEHFRFLDRDRATSQGSAAQFHAVHDPDDDSATSLHICLCKICKAAYVPDFVITTMSETSLFSSEEQQPSWMTPNVLDLISVSHENELGCSPSRNPGDKTSDNFEKVCYHTTGIEKPSAHLQAQEQGISAFSPTETNLQLFAARTALASPAALQQMQRLREEQQRQRRKLVLTSGAELITCSAVSLVSITDSEGPKILENLECELLEKVRAKLALHGLNCIFEAKKNIVLGDDVVSLSITGKGRYLKAIPFLSIKQFNEVDELYKFAKSNVIKQKERVKRSEMKSQQKKKHGQEQSDAASKKAATEEVVKDGESVGVCSTSSNGCSVCGASFGSDQEKSKRGAMFCHSIDIVNISNSVSSFLPLLIQESRFPSIRISSVLKSQQSGKYVAYQRLVKTVQTSEEDENSDRANLKLQENVSLFLSSFQKKLALSQINVKKGIQNVSLSFCFPQKNLLFLSLSAFVCKAGNKDKKPENSHRRESSGDKKRSLNPKNDKKGKASSPSKLKESGETLVVPHTSRLPAPPDEAERDEGLGDVVITPGTIPHAVALSYLSMQRIRETFDIKSENGMGGFVQSFVTEVLCMCRAAARAKGANAIESFSIDQFSVKYSEQKQQGYCVMCVSGDYVKINESEMNSTK